MTKKTMYVYTDGGVRGNGKENNIGSWGVFMIYGSSQRKMSGAVRDTTNNQMELMACIKALRKIKRKDIKIIVETDSKYVCSGINDWIYNWIKRDWKTKDKTPVKNQDLWKELFALKAPFKDISIVWCKGHSGNPGNEMADQLCNDAMDNLELG